jgi:hypothetical protein
MAIITAEILVEGAYRLLGKLTSLSTNDKNYGLEALNMILGNWSAEGLMIYAVTKESFTLTIGQAVYTIGDSGDFNTVRPLEIVDAFVRDSSDVDHPVKIGTAGRYNDITSKGINGRPTELYYTPEFPLGKIYLNAESSSAEALHLDSRKHLTEILVITDEISLPDEYKRALKFNLALELGPEKNTKFSQVIAQIASQSKRAIKRLNVLPTIEYQKFDPYLTYSLQR